jgi:glycosyltransferase involved in cell wall biosynthesis
LIVCEKNNKNFLISPHGSLENWSLNHKKYKKKLGVLVLGKFFKRANSFFVTSIEESESVEKIVGNSVNVVKHTLGVELRNIPRNISSYENNNILFVSRLSKKKGVDILIKSFINIGKKNWQLTIVGPSEDLYFSELKKLVIAKNYAENINFLGPLQKNELNKLYKTASFFALPSHSENFGFVIAEALAMKLPVLTTTGTPWREINEYSCGYCIENGENNFEKYMRKMMHHSSGELKTMGENGYKLIKNSYTWSSATKNILNKYNEALIG